MATSGVERRRIYNVGVSRPVVTLLIIETVLLFFSTLVNPRAGGVLGTVISTALAVVTFALPSVLGWLARSWAGAIGLALLPWWLTIILHAGTMLRARSGIGGFGLAFGTPAWLTASHGFSLLFTFLVFAVLGLVGWFIRKGLMD